MSQPHTGNHQPFDPQVALFCTCTGYVIVVMGLLIFGFLMGFIDPPSPSLAPEELLRWVQDNQVPMLLGCSILMLIWSLFIFWMPPNRKRPSLLLPALPLLGK